MIKKNCDNCNEEYLSTSNSRKYCDACRKIKRKDVEQKHYSKGGIGIYKITNILNGKVYIGQSVALHKRMNMHRNELKNNKHNNIHLQRAVNKYGFENFKFEIIENCAEEELYNKENYWILYYKSHEIEYGYNIILPSEDDRKYRLTDELKQNISECNTKYTDEELISFLQEFYYFNNTYPSSKDLENNPNLPSRKTYVNRFGSFKNALIEADIYDLIKDKRTLHKIVKYEKDDILNMIFNFINKHDRFPNSKELRCSSSLELPNYESIIKYFGSTENLKLIVGYDKKSIENKKKDEALLSLYELYQKHGKLNFKLINSEKSLPSVTYYTKHFGGLYEACEKAGIPEEYRVDKGLCRDKRNFKYSEEELELNFKITVKSYFDEFNKYPTRRDFDKLSRIGLSCYRARFNTTYLGLFELFIIDE